MAGLSSDNISLRRKEAVPKANPRLAGLASRHITQEPGHIRGRRTFRKLTQILNFPLKRYHEIVYCVSEYHSVFI